MENYRVAHGIHERNGSSQATTEDLREAMLRYRSLFDELLNLRAEGSGLDAPTDAPTVDRGGVTSAMTSTREEQR